MRCHEIRSNNVQRGNILLSFAVLLSCFFFLIPKSSSYTMENFYINFNSGDYIGLGALDSSSYILIEVNTGAINSTYSILEVGTDSGSWTFQSNVSCSFEVTDPAKNYDLRATAPFTLDETTGYLTKTCVANEVVTIYWEIPLTPIIPFGFIMGMVGLGSMFGGSLWIIKKVKDHEIHEAVTEGFIIAIVGAALFIAWLWAA